MSIKNFEKPIIELSNSLAFTKAKLIDNEYKLSIDDLNAAERLELISQFMKVSGNVNAFLQEYLDDACMDRSYAEMQLSIEQNERDLGYDF
jgi:hypothetical protein